MTLTRLALRVHFRGDGEKVRFVLSPALTATGLIGAASVLAFAFFPRLGVANGILISLIGLCGLAGFAVTTRAAYIASFGLVGTQELPSEIAPGHTDLKEFPTIAAVGYGTAGWPLSLPFLVLCAYVQLGLALLWLAVLMWNIGWIEAGYDQRHAAAYSLIDNRLLGGMCLFSRLFYSGIEGLWVSATARMGLIVLVVMDLLRTTFSIFLLGAIGRAHLILQLENQAQQPGKR